MESKQSVATIEYLLGKRVHIAGSISTSTNTVIANYAHELIRRLTIGILASGGGLVLGVGREPRAEGATIDSPSLTFDWTVLEVFASYLNSITPKWPAIAGSPIVIVTSEKSISEIPENRKALWENLLKSNLLKLEYILAGARSAAMIREQQILYGDLLLVLGGGTGVEHLAQLYMKHRRPVLPLDIPLGASREDGVGGAELLSREAKTDPQRFLKLKAGITETVTARLASIATQNGNSDVQTVSQNIITLLRDLAPQRVFYTRLLDRAHLDFPDIENFFRNVVDGVVNEAGYERYEMGIDKPEHGFMNVEIFQGVHFSPIVIADLTGSRPNCFIELGYALGNTNRTIITAREGTSLPFDTNAIPCHFWQIGVSDSSRRDALEAFWKININRPLLVKS